MPQTKRGIYHNLKESKYTISNSEVVFFFSSKFYMDKFLNTYQEEREKFAVKFTKFALPLNMVILSDLILYKTIEKRGFRAWYKGVDISWQEISLYALRKMTDENITDWYPMQKPKLEERIKNMV